MLSKSLILGAKLFSKSKGLEISEISNAIKNFKLPPNLNINSNATNFDKVVLNSKCGNKYIFSLKDNEGKLLQKFETDFGSDWINKSSDYLNQFESSDGLVAVTSNKGFSILPKHNRIRTTFYDKEKLIDYKETDVILYEGLNGKNGIKTIYEKNMPTPGYHNPFDINETSTIIGLLKNKGKFYQRRTTFDTRENIVDNWKSYSKGLKEGEAQWLDRDIWIHTRIQSDPKHITYSVLNQNKYSNVNVAVKDSIESNGRHYMSEGKGYIEINSKRSPLESFSTAVHETNHHSDENKMLEFLSKILKNMNEKEVQEYVKNNNDEVAYILKRYLKGDYGDKHKIRCLVYEKNLEVNDKEALKLINAHKNYVSPDENYELYRANLLEMNSWDASESALNQRSFYTEDYIRTFTPDFSDNPLNVSIFT